MPAQPRVTVMMVAMPSDRERLAATFDSAAGLYHQARPGYPAGVYDELVARRRDTGC